MSWSSHSCSDCRYSYLTRNICNRCVDSFKILFVATSEACSAIVTTIWRPGFKDKPDSNCPKYTKLSSDIFIQKAHSLVQRYVCLGLISQACTVDKHRNICPRVTDPPLVYSSSVHQKILRHLRKNRLFIFFPELEKD